MATASWDVQDAAARFDEVLEACLASGPQIVADGSQELAVLVPVAEWRQMTLGDLPSLKELLLTDFARGELNIPPRAKPKRRRQPTPPPA
jgi:prevent-host-death family protein